MNTADVIIGSNSRFGHGKSISGKDGKPGSTHNQTSRTFHVQKVNVYVDNTFVKQMPLKLLTRFSRVAADAFPKLASLSGTGPSSGNNSTPVKELRLCLDSLWLQPSLDAIDFAPAWMQVTQSTPRNAIPTEYFVPDPDNSGIVQLIDIYAASLVLELRPTPHRIRHDILARLSNNKPQVRDIQIVHEKLPINDTIMTRALTSYYQFDAKNKYSPEERKVIIDYVETIHDVLLHRFREIGVARVEGRKTRQAIRGAENLQKLAESGRNTNELIDAKVKEDINGNDTEERAGTKVEKKMTGRGGCGFHVLGANY